MTLFDYFNVSDEELKEAVMASNMDTTLKSMAVLVLNAYMEKERDEHLNVGKYERASERMDYRNGYYERELMLSIGTIKLKVPRTRDGSFSTSVFEKYARVDQAFVLAMLEMVVNGVSTRKVTNVVETLCGERVSKSFVSSLTERLDPVVNKWANRPLNVMRYTYLQVDAMYIKVRENRKVVPKAVYIATAINEENRREIIGLKIDAAESYEAWKGFFQDLKRRGLQSPNLIISDAHEGLKKAIIREFIGTSWQRCTVHLKRNLLDGLPKKSTRLFMADVRQIFHCANVDEARKAKEHLMEKYSDDPKMEKALAKLEDGFDDAIQFLNEPVQYHRFLSSTNHLERLNQEVRRRDRVIRIYPNEQSAFRLIGAVLMEENERLQKKRPLLKANS